MILDRPDTLRACVDKEFVISPDGKIIRWSKFYNYEDYDKDWERDKELYTETPSYVVVSIHNDICKKILANKGVPCNNRATDICINMGYLLIGGISHRIDTDNCTQAQLNTLFDLGFIR